LVALSLIWGVLCLEWVSALTTRVPALPQATLAHWAEFG